MTSGSSHGDTGEGGSVLGRVIWLSLSTDTQWQSKQLLGLTSLQLVLPWGMMLVCMVSYSVWAADRLFQNENILVSKKFPKYEKNAQRRILYWDKAWAGNASPSSFPRHVPSLELLQVFPLRNSPCENCLLTAGAFKSYPRSPIHIHSNMLLLGEDLWLLTNSKPGQSEWPIGRGSSTWVSF